MRPTLRRISGHGRPRKASRSTDASLSESVYQALLERILDGRLPSETVVSELALAGELGVSRTPVHDAVRQLAKDGLVVREGNRRARIAAFSAEDVYEVFEMRKYLEGPAADLAAGRMTGVELARLRADADDLLADADAADWVERWADFDEAFHRTIAQASGNGRLASDIDRYRLLHKGFNRTSTDAKLLRRAMDEHLAILDALAQRNGSLARERMVAHIGTWQMHFFRRVSPLPTSRRRTTVANSPDGSPR